MLVQFILTPFYLKYLGKHQFGLLMMLLSMINFAALGIGWMSGGLVRILGEHWENQDYQGFRNAFAVGKYVFTLYALGIVFIILVGWVLGQELQLVTETVSPVFLLAGLYFVLMYENAPERQAFVGTNRQATGNQLELLRVVLFALLTWGILPQIQDMVVVWVAMISGVLMQRVIMARYWSGQIKGIGWIRYQSEMKPIFRRLVGKQGAGYASYGALLLVLQADVMIVGFLGGPEAVAQFVLLWKIPEAIGLLLWRIPSTMEPRVIQLDVSGRRAELYSLFIQGRRWFFLLVFAVALIYMALGQWLTELWVGEHAPKEQWMYVMAGLALFFNTFARWPIAFAYALIRLKKIIHILIIEIVTKVSLTYLLYDYFYIAAPLVASVAVHVFYAAIQYQRLIFFSRYISR